MLIKDTAQYDFIRFTVYLADIFIVSNEAAFEEGREVIHGLRQVFINNEDDEDNIAMEMNVAGLSYISKLVDFISKIKIEHGQEVEAMARETESLTGLRIWDRYFEHAEQYFDDIKKMVDKDDWTTIEQQFLDAA